MPEKRKQTNSKTPSGKKNSFSEKMLAFLDNHTAALIITFRVILIIFIFTLVFLIGFWIYSAVCANSANWKNIKEEPADPSETEFITVVDTSDSVPIGDGFLSDLSDYEEYINPIGDMRDEFLILVNSSNPLSKNYVPPDLIESALTRNDGRNTQKLSLYAEKALEAMLIEAKALGIVTLNPKTKIELSLTLGYRSYEEQSEIFDTAVAKEMAKDATLTEKLAEDIASSYTQKPGTDDHQTGLSCDIHNMDTTSVAFKSTEAYQWLSENCWKFGFVLRYPEDKINATGVAHSPWQFRYIGRYHANQMKTLGYCLEEYIDYLDSLK